MHRLGVVVPLVAALGLLGLVLGLMMKERSLELEEVVPIVVEGPEVVVGHRDAFRSAIDALAHNDAAEAISILDSFSFGERAVEPYRLYLLANAYSLAGDVSRSRRMLERSWRRDPRMVVSTDVAYHLISLHARDHRWGRVASVSRTLAESHEDDIVGASARREQLKASFYSGDAGGLFRSALDLAVTYPESDQADGVLDLVAGMRGRTEGDVLDATERLTRAERLLESRFYPQALDLANRIDSSSLSSAERDRLTLVRGTTLGRLGRHKESEEVLADLFSGAYKVAIPALEASARNRRLMAAASRKTEEKDRHLVLYHERLRDLLSLPIESSLRALALERLVDAAEEDGDVEQMKKLITALVRTDPTSDRGLQLMWDQGWLAWEKGNDPVAIDRFDFIYETYGNPAIRRQARYWLGRSLERAGRSDRSEEIFLAIADVAYEDLYSQFAVERLGSRGPGKEDVPFALAATQDWSEIAEREMPAELRLAWELTLLGEYSEARAEIRRHRDDSNERFADALLAESFHADGAWQIANRYLKRAYPSIGTSEQNDVPLHFLKMYYVLPYEEEILEHSISRDIDPAFVAALVHQETTFNPRAVSPVGAKGLMQLMPGTAREVGERLYTVYQEERLFDPAFNIDLGTYYINQVLEMMDGDHELAAAGYNGGPYRIRKWRRESDLPRDEFLEGMPLSETRNYVKRVAILRSSYRTLYPALRLAS